MLVVSNLGTQGARLNAPKTIIGISKENCLEYKVAPIKSLVRKQLDGGRHALKHYV